MSEPAGHLEVRAYAELNEFLPPESRGVTVRRPFRSHQTVKDVLEAMGIPHTEVDLILVTGLRADSATARASATGSWPIRCSRRWTWGRPPGCGRFRCGTRALSSM